MRWKIWKKSKLNSETIGKIGNKSKLNGEMIGKIWNKSKLNSNKIWKVWKKSKFNSEKIWKIRKKNVIYRKGNIAILYMLAKYVPGEIKYIFTKFYRHISTK